MHLAAHTNLHTEKREAHHAGPTPVPEPASVRGVTMSASHLQRVEKTLEAPISGTSLATPETAPKKRLRGKDKPAGKPPAKASTNAPKPQKREPQKRQPLAQDVMQSPAICCHEHATLNDAARLMWEHDLGALPVVNDARQPVGMITDRDACMAAYTQGVALYHAAVASAMSKTLVLCDVSAPVAEIRGLMIRAQVRRLPVVDAHGTLVGVVGLSDIVKEAHAPLPKDRRRGSSGPLLMQLVDAILQPSKLD